RARQRRGRWDPRREPHRRAAAAPDGRRTREPRRHRPAAARRLPDPRAHRQHDRREGGARDARPPRRWPATAVGRRQRARTRGGPRDARAVPTARSSARVSGALRVLPLGGLGEIGKNMTVVEYEGRIVVVDVGLRFPTPEMVGIDLVLPDFAYLRARVEDIEAIVVTHGHEDHLGALPWVLRDLGETASPPVYGGALTVAMARSKLDEHKLREVELVEAAAGET